MPHTLTDPSHWGCFEWKYIKLYDSKNFVGLVLEFGENADVKPVQPVSDSTSKNVDVEPMEEHSNVDELPIYRLRSEYPDFDKEKWKESLTENYRQQKSTHAQYSM